MLFNGLLSTAVVAILTVVNAKRNFSLNVFGSQGFQPEGTTSVMFLQGNDFLDMDKKNGHWNFRYSSQASNNRPLPSAEYWESVETYKVRFTGMNGAVAAIIKPDAVPESWSQSLEEVTLEIGDRLVIVIPRAFLAGVIVPLGMLFSLTNFKPVTELSLDYKGYNVFCFDQLS